jgi:phosphate transport system substrate-binding protein
MHGFWFNTLSFVLMAMVVAGCGRERQQGSGGEGAAMQTITQKGSDTMILLCQKWAEKFAAVHPDIVVQASGGGSGTGISALINGTTDIATASRPMKPAEREQIKQKFGSDVVEIPVARDAIAIYVHKDNPIESLTIEQLRGIYSGTIKNWKEVGGPDATIILYGRENSSGTYEYFKEHVLDKGDFPSNTQTLQGTAAIVSAIGKDTKGIGYGGAAYTAAGVKQVKLAGESGEAMIPTTENVKAGTYALSRNLYFYLRGQPSGALKTYVDWVLGAEGQKAVTEAGEYFPV